MKPMTDAKTTVTELRGRVLAFVQERDWEQFHSPKNLSMALAAESSNHLSVVTHALVYLLVVATWPKYALNHASGNL